MKKRIISFGIIIAICSIFLSACGTEKAKDSSTIVNSSESNKDDFNKKGEVPKELPIATIKIKDYGTVTAELYPQYAPNTVNNFISLANSGFYNNTTFHRIISDFMIQGGDPEGTGLGGPGYTIAGEFKSNGYDYNELKHENGVLSMARSNSPDSAGSQFFIVVNEENCKHLDGAYATFGKVTEGMDIVNEVAKVETDKGDKPLKDVIIESISVDTKGVQYSEPIKK